MNLNSESTTKHQNSRPVVIAVDGPAGSGKSSICKSVRKVFGWDYLSTGTIYRAVGYLLFQKFSINPGSLEISDGDESLQRISEGLRWDSQARQLVFEGEPLSSCLYSVETTRAASIVAASEKVREILLPLQRKIALESQKGVLVDGRDIGTVVFPDADLKVFLTASLKVRAERRLMQTSNEITEDVLHKSMEELDLRDKRDAERSVAPLKKADDAHVIDSSNAQFDEVVSSIVELIRRELPHQRSEKI